MADLRLSLVFQFSDWSKVTPLQVHGSPVLKTLLLQSFWCISATRFAELIQFWQDPKDFIFRFASYFLLSDIYIYIYIIYIYI